MIPTHPPGLYPYLALELTSLFNTAQTDVQDASADASADDFLAREKALLGEDADKFATAEDGVAFDGGDDDDLLGGGGGGETAQFEQQFPDISGPNEVRSSLTPQCIAFTTHHPLLIYLRSYRQSLLVETLPQPALP